MSGTGVVVGLACLSLLGAGAVMISLTRRVVRLVGVMVLGAAVVLATNWWMQGMISGK